MASAETAKLFVALNLKDGLTSGIKKATGTLTNFDRGVGRVGKGVGQMGLGFARAGVIIAGAAVTGLAAAAKVGADFEAQLNIINTIARKTPEDLKVVGDGIRALARDGRGDLADLSAGYYDILSAGIAAADAQSVLDASTRLAIGGLSTTAQSVDLITTAINAYGQSASMATYDADLFAKSIELGKVTADEIAASFANVAPIAAQQGINIEEIAAAYAALTAQGTPAAEVTTQMSRAILDLLSPNKELNALQEKTGKNFMAIAKEKGLVVALQAMRDAVGGDEQAFKDLFGRVEGYKFALQTTGPQQEKYNEALAAMGAAGGTATAQMAERMQGLAFQTGRLKANLIDVGIELAAGFTPALGRAADKLSTFLSDSGNRSSIRQLGQDIGSAIDSIDWDKMLGFAKALVGALKPAVTLATTIASIVANLPPGLLGAGAGLVVTNKLSGGLIADGLGNILGGLGQTALATATGGAIGATPVRVVNWPAGGLGGGTVTGGRTVGGALGTAAKIVAPVAVLAAGIQATGINDPGRTIVPGTGNVARQSTQNATVAGKLATIDASLKALAGRTDTNAQRLTAQLLAARAQLVANKSAATQDSLRETMAEKQSIAAQRTAAATTGAKLNTANARLAAIQRKRTSFTSVTNVSIPVTIRDIQGAQNRRRRIVKRSVLEGSTDPRSV
jgi:TP901 family phage tail tape measure protein